jgi:hypothetical protein
MGLRGPKPINKELLQQEAMMWAWFFYTLRDGQSGYMQQVKLGKLQSTPGMSSNMKHRIGTPLGPPILIPVTEAARTLPSQIRAKGWVVFRPVMPAPELWTLIKQARSAAEIRDASRKIRKWMDQQFGMVGRWLPGDPSVEYCDALQSCSEQLVIGKRLPNYPKTARPGSDDKRVQFLSKVLAGARHGLAPITAAKRLSHCNWPSGESEKTLLEFLERSNKQFESQEKTTHK